MTDGAADPRMLPDHIGSPMSIFTDAEIKQAMDLGYIFRENGDRNFVRQASYELRVGDSVKLLRNNRNAPFEDEGSEGTSLFDRSRRNPDAYNYQAPPIREALLPGRRDSS